MVLNPLKALHNGCGSAYFPYLSNFYGYRYLKIEMEFSLRGEGVRPIILEICNFEIRVKGEGQEHVPLFSGWFLVHAHNVAHVRPKRKNGAKDQI